MEHHILSELLRILPTNAAVRTPDCPDDHTLAASVDGQLPDESIKQIALHLADCDFCTAQVGLLKRLHGSESEQRVNEFVLARARRMGKSNKRSTFRHVPRWASAAVVVLAVLLVSRWSSFNQENPGVIGKSLPDLTPQVFEPRQSRNLNSDILKLRVLAPSNGSTIDPGSLVFQWTEIPGSLYYNVRVVTDGGDLIWQTRVNDTESGLPEYLQLKPDTAYFFRVDAYLASAKSISSQHVLFSIGEQH